MPFPLDPGGPPEASTYRYRPSGKTYSELEQEIAELKAEIQRISQTMLGHIAQDAERYA